MATQYKNIKYYKFMTLLFTLLKRVYFYLNHLNSFFHWLSTVFHQILYKMKKVWSKRSSRDTFKLSKKFVCYKNYLTTNYKISFYNKTLDILYLQSNFFYLILPHTGLPIIRHFLKIQTFEREPYNLFHLSLVDTPISGCISNWKYFDN